MRDRRKFQTRLSLITVPDSVYAGTCNKKGNEI
jgi:hypothetical protein